MNYKAKKDLKILWFLLPLLGLFLLLIVLNVYILTIDSQPINGYVLYFSLLIVIIMLFPIFSVIFTPRTPIELKENEVIIRKFFSETVIPYDEIFYSFSAYANESSFFKWWKNNNLS